MVREGVLLLEVDDWREVKPRGGWRETNATKGYVVAWSFWEAIKNEEIR